MATTPPALPRSIIDNPRLDQWLRFTPDGRVTVLVGKVELGQGIAGALRKIAADELDFPLDRVDIHAGETQICPDEGFTAGSQSIEVGGAAVRYACAHAVGLLRAAAEAALGADPERVEGAAAFRSVDRSIDYHALADAIDWGAPIDGAFLPRPASEYRWIGKSVPRHDLEATVRGAAFIQDMELPDMVHARVVRGPLPDAEIVDLDYDALRARLGVTDLVRIGRFLAVCALREEQAVAGAAWAATHARWSGGTALPPSNRLADMLVRNDASVLERVVATSPRPAGGERLSARYTRPFIAHGSMGPSCALAQYDEEQGLSVWTHCQGVYPLRLEISKATGIAKERIHVAHVRGAGCYGHNGADDAAFDAALIALALPGRPVRLQWTREDELSRSPFGSAMIVDLSAEVSPEGDVQDWSLEVWTGCHAKRPGIDAGVNLLAAREIDPPLPEAPGEESAPETGGRGSRNSIAIYDFPNHAMRCHLVPQLPVRTSSLRTLGGFANVFAIESFIDEIAEKTGEDPVALRLRYLHDPRARAVVTAAAEMADWPAKAGLKDGHGAGFAFARYKNKAAYVAIVAEIELGDDLMLRHVHCVVDAGMAIDPDGLTNQIEGGIIQAASWTLKEEVRFGGGEIETRDWDSYPILRFSEMPRIDVQILDRRDDPPLGVGEASLGPTAGAIANATTRALGLRLREMPFTRERILAAVSM